MEFFSVTSAVQTVMNVNENVGRSKDELCNRCEAPWVTLNASDFDEFLSQRMSPPKKYYQPNLGQQNFIRLSWAY